MNIEAYTPTFLEATNKDEKGGFLEHIHEMLSVWNYQDLEAFLNRFVITHTEVKKLFDMAQHAELSANHYQCSEIWNEYLESLKVKSSNFAPFPFIRKTETEAVK